MEAVGRLPAGLAFVACLIWEAEYSLANSRESGKQRKRKDLGERVQQQPADNRAHDQPFHKFEPGN